jgi:glycerate 2-kinase
MRALSTCPSVKTLHEVFLQALPQIDLRRQFSRVEPILAEIHETARLAPVERVVRLISVGKAAVPMVEELMRRCALEKVLGLVSSPYERPGSLPGLEIFSGGHPRPNEDSLCAARRAEQVLAGLTPDDLVVFLFSGGGSAALEAPLDPAIQLSQLRTTYDVLVGCGADIVEINAVRKHLSAVKGGRLAQAAFPARQVTLYASDVPAGHDSAVASGPTMPDETTVEDARRVLRTYRLDDRLPADVRTFLHSAPETPKAGDPVFDRSSWHCLVSNVDAVNSVRDGCARRGWQCEVDTTTDEEPVERSVEFLLKRLDRLAKESAVPVCLIAGGEVRSIVRGAGTGGRNQAFVLECVPRIAGRRRAVLSAGTDGIDGNSDAAGAVADGQSLGRATALGLDLAATRAASDSGAFFRTLGDDLVTGPTGNNVRDIRLLLAW